MEPRYTISKNLERGFSIVDSEDPVVNYLVIDGDAITVKKHLMSMITDIDVIIQDENQEKQDIWNKAPDHFWTNPDCLGEPAFFKRVTSSVVLDEDGGHTVYYYHHYTEMSLPVKEIVSMDPFGFSGIDIWHVIIPAEKHLLGSDIRVRVWHKPEGS